MKLFTLLSLSLCLLMNTNAFGIPPVNSADNFCNASNPGTTSANATPAAADLTGRNKYYFSNTEGDDSRTNEQAQNPSTPWKTIQKLNNIMSSLKPGDAILFKRGELFYGQIIITQSGSEGYPIAFSAYGDGPKPVIHGLSTVSNWNALGNGIWEARLAARAYLNMVLVNALVQPMGRFPNITNANRGYLTIESHSGTSQLTDNELGTSTNWTGAEVVVRKNDWTLDRAPITAHSGNTLWFTSPTGHQPIDGYGYFIQNSPLTLDQTGEWYYNPSTKKIKMYTGSANPKNFSIVASTIDTLVFINNKSYITIDNLAFRGANVTALQLNNSRNIKIQYVDINYSGLDGISADNSPYLSIENSTVNHSNNSGIRLYQGSSYATIKNNSVKNSGLIPGMGSSNNQQHDGIFVDSSPYNSIELNKVDSSGYCGITFTGDYTSVKNNAVNYFCLTVNDGGGIYSWGGWDKVGRIVTGNVVLNGIGAPAGTNSTIPGGAVGIYTDDRSSHIDITNNTVANCVRAGIYLHNSHEMNITGNTLYNNGIQLSMVHDALEPGDPIRNITTTGNIMSSNKYNRFMVENISMLNDICNFGSYNNNYYVRPTDESGIITTKVIDNGQDRVGFYSLAGWTAAYGYDKQSSNSPFKLPAYTVNGLIGANKFANGSFNSSTEGVMCLSSPGAAAASFNSGGKLDGGAVKISFDASGGATNEVGTFIGFGAVAAGKTYLIKFSLLGTTPCKTIKSFILENGGAYKKLSDTRYFDLSSVRTENEFLFTAPATTSNAMIALELAGPDCPFWLDNFSVYEANVTPVNIDQYMRFEYNGTGKPKAVSLSGTYVDATNKQYSGRINIPAFSSVILMKQAVVTTTQTYATVGSGQNTITLSDAFGSTDMKITASPNPAHNSIQVAVDLPGNFKSATMSIFSLSGVSLMKTVLSGIRNSIPVDISSFNNGVYIITMVCDGQVTTKKFVKE